MVRLSLLEKVVECKKAYVDFNMPKAYEFWCSIYDEIEQLEKTEDVEKVRKEHFRTMELFSDNEVYDITDYGKTLERSIYD